MSLDRAKAHLDQFGLAGRIHLFAVSSATVEPAPDELERVSCAEGWAMCAEDSRKNRKNKKFSYSFP